MPATSEISGNIHTCGSLLRGCTADEWWLGNRLQQNGNITSAAERKR